MATAMELVADGWNSEDARFRQGLRCDPVNWDYYVQNWVVSFLMLKYFAENRRVMVLG